MELIKVNSDWKDHELRIEFMIGNTCNYKCWYCYPGSNEGTHRWGEYQTIVTNFTHLINHYKNNGKTKIYLHLAGGEPTLWPQLGEFVQAMSDLGCVISMSTNGSRTIRWWQENAKYFNRVLLSCHHQEMDISHTIQVADILYENKAIVDASVLMDPNCWDKCVSIIQNLRKSKHRWGILAAEIVHDSIQYTTSQLKFIEKHLHRIPNLFWFFRNKKHHMNHSVVVTTKDAKSMRVGMNYIRLHKLNHFDGWDCNLGKDSIYVNKYGEITGTCGAFLYRNNFHYNIYDSDFVEQFTPIISSTICNISSCYCEPEINLRKVIPIKAV